jgi:hypothetical protein
VNDQPTNDHMDEAGAPMTDEFEMELRGRLTVLEQRIGLIFWLAVIAEVGVIALAGLWVLEAWKERTT